MSRPKLDNLIPAPDVRKHLAQHKITTSSTLLNLSTDELASKNVHPTMVTIIKNYLIGSGFSLMLTQKELDNPQFDEDILSMHEQGYTIHQIAYQLTIFLDQVRHRLYVLKQNPYFNMIKIKDVINMADAPVITGTQALHSAIPSVLSPHDKVYIIPRINLSRALKILEDLPKRTYTTFDPRTPRIDLSKAKRFAADLLNISPDRFATYPSMIATHKGEAIETVVNHILSNLPEDKEKFIRFTYGLRNGDARIAQKRVAARACGIHYDRVEEAESVAFLHLRKWAHLISPYRYFPTSEDLSEQAARSAIYEKLCSTGYGARISLEITMALKKDHVKEALKHTEHIGTIVAKSCKRTTVNLCQNCNQPTLPGWTFCSKECQLSHRTLTITCDQCGKEFKRPTTQVLYDLKDKYGVEGARNIFCSPKCHGYWRKGKPRDQVTFRPVSLKERKKLLGVSKSSDTITDETLQDPEPQEPLDNPKWLDVPPYTHHVKAHTPATFQGDEAYSITT